MSTVVTLAGFGGDPIAMTKQLGGAITDGNTIVPVHYNNAGMFAQTVSSGAKTLDTVLASVNTDTGVIVFAHSLGAAVAGYWINTYAINNTNITTANTRFVLIGNMSRPAALGGFSATIFPAAVLSAASCAFTVDDITTQYDGMSDWPTVTTAADYVLAVQNAQAGIGLLHPHYENVPYRVGEYFVPYSSGTTPGSITYWWSTTFPLPVLGTTITAAIDADDSVERPGVEAAYDRPVTMPTPVVAVVAAACATADADAIGDVVVVTALVWLGRPAGSHTSMFPPHILIVAQGHGLPPVWSTATPLVPTVVFAASITPPSVAAVWSGITPTVNAGFFVPATTATAAAAGFAPRLYALPPPPPMAANVDAPVPAVSVSETFAAPTVGAIAAELLPITSMTSSVGAAVASGSAAMFSPSAVAGIVNIDAPVTAASATAQIPMPSTGAVTGATTGRAYANPAAPTVAASTTVPAPAASADAAPAAPVVQTRVVNTTLVTTAASASTLSPPVELAIGNGVAAPTTRATAAMLVAGLPASAPPAFDAASYVTSQDTFSHTAADGAYVLLMTGFDEYADGSGAAAVAPTYAGTPMTFLGAIDFEGDTGNAAFTTVGQTTAVWAAADVAGGAATIDATTTESQGWFVLACVSFTGVETVTVSTDHGENPTTAFGSLTASPTQTALAAITAINAVAVTGGTAAVDDRPSGTFFVGYETGGDVTFTGSAASTFSSVRLVMDGVNTIPANIATPQLGDTITAHTPAVTITTTAPTPSADATAHAPAVSGAANTVAPMTTATAATTHPVVALILDIPATTTASAAAHTATVTGTGRVATPANTLTAASAAPLLRLDWTVRASGIAAQAVPNAPHVSSGQIITPTTATTAAAAGNPSVGLSGVAEPPAATANATTHAPMPAVAATPHAAHASGDANPPAVSLGWTISTTPAFAHAGARVDIIPVIVLAASAADAATAAPAPTLGFGRIVTAATGEANAESAPATLSLGRTLGAAIAAATGVAETATPTIIATPDTADASATAHACTPIVAIVPHATAIFVEIPASTVTETLTSFPLYIDLATMPDDFWDAVTADGGDIRTYNGTGATQLPREIVAIDTTARTGQMWMLADTISATDGRVFIVVVDGVSTEPAANSTYGAQSVWIGYTFVSHNGGKTDSSPNQIVTSASTSTPGTATMPIGTGASFNGSQYYVIGNASQTQMPSTLTLSAWVDNTSASTLPNATGCFIGKSDNYDLSVIKSNAQLFAYTWSSSDEQSSLLASYTVDANAHYLVETINTPTNTIEIYADGKSYASGTGGAGGTSTSVLTVGALSGPIGIVANISEVRLTSDIRDAAWVAAEHANQSSPSTFYTTALLVGYATVTAKSTAAALPPSLPA